MATKILLDVDTGIDDAMALLYAIGHPDLDVVGISCVAGNANLDHVVANTLRVLDAAGAPDIPVARGASRPLLERNRPAAAVHGADGLGGISLPESNRSNVTGTATDMLATLIMTAAEPLTLVALAPQTNIAMLLAQYPEVADQLERIVFMGGSASVGNATAVAEFNVWHDPEAASAVIESGIPITMYGLDVFNRLPVDEGTANRFAAHHHPAISLTGQLLHSRISRADGTVQDYSGVIGDAGTLVMLTHPDLFHREALPTRVNLAGIGRGQTLVDRRPDPTDPSDPTAEPWPIIEVALDLDSGAAAQAFVDVIDSYA